jgi:hypothetical protein
VEALGLRSQGQDMSGVQVHEALATIFQMEGPSPRPSEPWGSSASTEALKKLHDGSWPVLTASSGRRSLTRQTRPRPPAWKPSILSP